MLRLMGNPMSENLGWVGTSPPRRDLRDKVTGRAEYAADISFDNMLYAKVLRSPHPHARILLVDTLEACMLPGVKAIVTPFDIPDGRVAPDVSILDQKVRFVGDEVAVVAADNPFTAELALKLIKVSYDVLSFSSTTDEALSDSAEPIHEDGNLINNEPLVEQRGNIKEGFAEADLIVEESFTTPAHSPAPLEPRTALAKWDGSKLTVWKSSRGIHADKTALSQALGLPAESVRVIGPHMGAGYGGKDETRTAALASILSMRTQAPVRLELSREEEFVAGRRRHSTQTTLRMGLKKDGEITAIHAKTVMDTGAYLSSGPGVVRRAGQGALYLYRCPNVRYEGYLVYTNSPTAGSYRALGAPQGHYALECVADLAAESLGIDSLEFRRKNHVTIEGQPGERITPVNQIVDTQPSEGGIPFSSNGLSECLELGADRIGWGQPVERIDKSASRSIKRGRGMSMFIYRGGPGGKSHASIALTKDSSYSLSTGVMDVGEGSATVLSQIASQVLSIPYDAIDLVMGDTDITPEASITAGSSVTFSSGLAVKNAAEMLRDKILYQASLFLGEPQHVLSLQGSEVTSDSGALLSISDLVEHSGPISAEATIVPGSPDYVINSFGAHFVEVEVDVETGKVNISRYVAAHDAGTVINPKMAENQVRGGVSQMMGFTFLEDMETDPGTGIVVNGNFLDHKSPTILDFPDIDVIFADIIDPIGPFGAKSLGEPPCIGPAPTIANAIYDAVGIRITDLPITPHKLLAAIKSHKA